MSGFPRGARRAFIGALALAVVACGGTADDFLSVGGRNGSGSTDRTAPTVAATDPVTGSTNVPRTTVVRVTFSEPVDSASVTNAAFSFSPGTTGTIVVAGAVATFTPSTPFPANTVVTATVSGVRDRAGNTLAGPTSFTFTTAS